MTAATAIGHNQAPTTFFEWALEMMGSDMLPAEKLVTFVAVVAQTGKIEEISRLIGMPARTVERARYRPARDGWLHITGAVGRGARRTYLPGFPDRIAPVSLLPGDMNDEATRSVLVMLASRPAKDVLGGGDANEPPHRRGHYKKGKANEINDREENLPTDADLLKVRNTGNGVPFEGPQFTRARAYKESLRDTPFEGTESVGSAAAPSHLDAARNGAAVAGTSHSGVTRAPTPLAAGDVPPLTGELFGPGEAIPRPTKALVLSKAQLDAMERQMLDACNGAIDNPVNCMGLLNMSVPKWWIESGCDFDLDVMPALRAAGRRYHGKKIRSWDYFTGMVSDARASREQRNSMPVAARGDAAKTEESKTERTARKVADARERLTQQGKAPTHG